jgi:hypothetical protein
MYLIINDKGYTMAEGDMQPVITVNKYGDKFWKLNARLHREDGPAIEWATGEDDKEWYLFGIPYLFEEWLDQHPHMTDEQKVMYKLEYG